MGLSDLVTCIVERKGAGWSLMYASDGKTPKDFSASSLSEAVERASSEVAAMYEGHKELAAAELQFAIYPWRGDRGKVILDISQDADGLTVRDIQGTGITFHSDSIDAVIADAEKYLPNTGDAMIRWIRPIAGLTRR